MTEVVGCEVWGVGHEFIVARESTSRTPCNTVLLDLGKTVRDACLLSRANSQQSTTTSHWGSP